MKKYYKLKKDLPTFHAGDVFVLENNGCLYWVKDKTEESNHWQNRVMAYHARTLASFHNILGEWFEEIQGNDCSEPKDDSDWTQKNAYQLCLLTGKGYPTHVQKRVGFLIIQADSVEEALDVASDALDFNYSVEKDSAKRAIIARERQEIE